MQGEVLIPDCFVEGVEAVLLEHRGIVDEQIQRAKCLCGACDQRRSLGRIGEIGAKRDGLRFTFREGLGQCFRFGK